MNRAEKLAVLTQTAPGGHLESGDRVYRAGSAEGGPGRSFHFDLENDGWSEENAGAGASGYGLKKYLEHIGAADKFPDVGDHKPTPQTKRVPACQIVPAPKPPEEISHSTLGVPVATWPYYSTADRGLIGYACRFETSTGKSVLYYVHGVPTAAPDGSPPIWQWGQFPSPFPLYNQQALQDPNRSALPVVVVEGEKAAAALQAATNVVVTTWPGGSGKAMAADWQRLRGRQVIILPDHDKPGAEAGSIIRRRVRPFATAVCILFPPHVSARLGENSIDDGWDIDDTQLGADEAGANAIGAAILALAPVAFEAQSAESEYALDEKGNIKATLGNALTAIEETEEIKVAFDFDTQLVFFRKEPPWARSEDSGPYYLYDEDIPEANRYLNRRIGTNFNKTDLRDSFKTAARKNQTSLFLERLGEEEWDGVARVDRLWQNLGCREFTEKEVAATNGAQAWSEWCARILLCGIVARAMQPGIQHDAMLVLEGAQEVGKTSLFRTLGGDDGYYSLRLKSLNQSSSEKDSMLSLTKARIVEIEELADMDSVKTETTKAFLSQKSDKFRAPYDTGPRTHDRRCVFVASTNRSDYLRDTTGNRRFIPYAIELAPGTIEFNIDWVKQNRWQLFAEAREMVFAGFSLQMPFELREYADSLRADRFVEDPWTEVIIQHYNLNKPTNPWVSTLELIQGIIGIPKERITNDHYKRVRSIMSLFGCEHKRTREDRMRVGKYDITPIIKQAHNALTAAMVDTAAAEVVKQWKKYPGTSAEFFAEQDREKAERIEKGREELRVAEANDFAPPPISRPNLPPMPADDYIVYCQKCGDICRDPEERREEVHLTCKLNGPPNPDSD